MNFWLISPSALSTPTCRAAKPWACFTVTAPPALSSRRHWRPGSLWRYWGPNQRLWTCPRCPRGQSSLSTSSRRRPSPRQFSPRGWTTWLRRARSFPPWTRKPHWQSSFRRCSAAIRMVAIVATVSARLVGDARMRLIYRSVCMISHSNQNKRRPRPHDLIFVSPVAWRSLLKTRDDLAGGPLVIDWHARGWPLLPPPTLPPSPPSPPLLFPFLTLPS